MSAIVFNNAIRPNAENEYIQWLKDNPNGYVLQTTKTMPATYMSLHRATCHKISQKQIHMSGDVFTGNGYIKICSDSPSELLTWIKHQGGSQFTKLCSFCSPDVEPSSIAKSDHPDPEKNKGDKNPPTATGHDLFDVFVSFVATKQGEVLRTIGGRASFMATVAKDGIKYTPSATGKPRSQTIRHARTVFERYLESGSLAPSDYLEVTQNSSYILALIELFFSTGGSTEEADATETGAAMEGMTKERRYLSKSRNRLLAEERKKRDGHTCQACGFNVTINGRSVVECHHLYPIGSGDPRITGINDLVTLCPTCHRMVHLQSPPLNVAAIQDQLRTATKPFGE